MEGYSVVIPVYNTAEVLKELQLKIDTVFKQLDAKYEIIFIDDSSPNPHTWVTLCNLVDNFDNITAIRLSRNFGQHSATICGLSYAKGEYIITMDDDMQHDPFDIPLLLKKSSHDIVIGTYKNKKHSFLKNIASNLKSYLDYKLLKKPKHLKLTAFRLLNRNIVNGILRVKTSNPFLPALMFYITQDVCQVNVEHYNRQEGKSGYSAIKMIKLISSLIINNSSVLLRFIGIIGLVMMIFSIIVIVALFYRSFVSGVEVEGWTSLISTILLFGGLQLLSIGVIGEYLIRIIRETEYKPSYFVKELKS